jgi:hypothetical protein
MTLTWIPVAVSPFPAYIVNSHVLLSTENLASLDRVSSAYIFSSRSTTFRSISPKNIRLNKSEAAKRQERFDQ